MLAVILPVLGGLAMISLAGGASSASTTAPSARPAAGAFANGYASFLNGRLAASSLPEATPAVRALAASGGDVPPAYRGRVALHQVVFTGVLGARQARALIVARAGAHTLEAELGLTYTGRQWQVSALVPPDFSTVFSPPPPPVQVPAAARAAARAFALDYADYRTGARATPPAGLSTIRGQIAAGHDPLSGIPRAHAAAQLTALHLLPQGQSSPVDAVLVAGGRRLRFTFILARSGNGWQAWQFPVRQP
jgi:hypothetical protein